MSQKPSNYTQGYSQATLSGHAARTIDTDAAFLKPYIKPTDQVLDVGCGPGSITIGFAALVPQGSVIGVDIAEEVLSQARETASRPSPDGSPAHQGNLSFQQADMLAGLPFADNTFDIVFESQVFPHLATTEMQLQALTEMRRVLKPGGILATRDSADAQVYPRHYDLDRLWTQNMMKAVRNGDPNAKLPGGEMLTLFRRVGFDAKDGKLKAGASTTVWSGRERREFFAGGFMGRLAPGDPYRESWLKVGVSEAEINETMDAFRRWIEDDDGWCVVLQADILGWK